MAEPEHDLDIARAVGTRALGYLKEYKAAPSPQNYALLYHHTTGHDQALSAAVHMAVTERGGFTAEEAERLYAKFLSPANRVAPVRAALASEAAKAQRLLAQAADNSDDLWFSLQVAQIQLGDLAEAKGLGDVVRDLVTAAAEVARQNYVLEQQLAACQEQIRQLRQVLADIQCEQERDRLTGLPSRRCFHEAVAKEIAAARDGKRPLCLLLADLDEFRAYNEAHGHRVGDQILRLVGEIVGNLASKGAQAARYGGDEFAIVAPDLPVEDGVCLAERVRAAVAMQRFVRKASGRPLGPVTVSVGVAALEPEDDPPRLLARACRCLDAAKRQGRNRVQFDGVAGARQEAAWSTGPVS